MSEVVQLIDLCKEELSGKYGIPASAEDYDSNKVRYLRITDIDDNGNLLNSDIKSVSSADINKYLLSEGDIVFARTGNSTGRTYYHQEKNGKLAFAGFLIKFSLDSRKVNPMYLKYYTISSEYKAWVKNLSNGSTRGNINAQTFASCPIKLPERVVQDNLVQIMSAIDQKIALNNQINEELEAMAKTLYDYWFVQFDFPDENGKPYKSSGGKMVYNDQLKREIPEGWGVKQLGELSTYVTDKISSNDLNSKNYIGTDNMLSNMKGIEQATYLPNSTLVNSFIPNDILIANIRPYFKKIWISDRTGGCSSDVLCLRANDKEICNYLFYSLARDDFFNYNVAGSKGSKMPRGDKAHIQKYSVLFSEKHALKFSKLVSNFISQKHLIYKQNQELSQLRDWLLPMLMNGQVRVEQGE